MNKNLLTAILQNAKYPNPEVLTELVFGVPNKEVALEMLLGIHKPKQLDLFWSTKNADTLYFVHELDELNNTIKFDKFTQKTERIWYKTKQDKENNVYVTDRPNDYYDWSTKPVFGYIKEECQTSDAEEFLRRAAPMPHHHWIAIRESWEGEYEVVITKTANGSLYVEKVDTVIDNIIDKM